MLIPTSASRVSVPPRNVKGEGFAGNGVLKSEDGVSGVLDRVAIRISRYFLLRYTKSLVLPYFVCTAEYRGRYTELFNENIAAAFS
jgi:hypothetical protein